MDELFGNQIKQIDILYKICRRMYIQNFTYWW